YGSLYTELNGGYFISKKEGLFGIISPKWKLYGGLYFWDKLFSRHLDLKTGLRANAFSSYFASNFNQHEQAYFIQGNGNLEIPEIPGAATLDFILIAHLGSAYVHFILENLLDKQYIITSFYPMNERNLRFGISWDFLD